VVEPWVIVPRAAIVWVWMSFWMAFQMPLAKENAWLGATVTLGCLGSNSVKKDKVFICKIDAKQVCEKGGFVSNFYVPNAQR
jgi:hypothetical protein